VSEQMSSGIRAGARMRGAGMLLIGVAGTLALIGYAPEARSEAPAACTAAEYRQFDFWLGDWDAFDYPVKAPAVARTIITSLLGGCAVHEQYDGTNGLHGRSYSIFDKAHAAWHQTWVTSRGRLLLLDGKWSGGRLVMTGNTAGADGRAAVTRVSWWKVPEGVRELGETSVDGGHGWSVDFDLLFKPHHE